MVSGKIFVDLDEEIIFTVEKILESDSKRVIVVIPESANLVASLISLKLLSRQIAKSPKSIVLVTEDKLGLRLAKEAGLVAKEKISEITPKIWVEAEDLKKLFLDSRKKTKDKLIDARSEKQDYEIVDDEKEKEQKAEDKKEEGEKDEGKEKSKKKENEIEYVSSLAQKPRLEPKVVNLGVIKVLSGGDIEKNPDFIDQIEKTSEKETMKEKESAVYTKKKDEVTNNKATNSEAAPVENKEEIIKDQAAPSSVNTVQKTGIIGRDWSSYLPQDKPRRSRQRTASQDQPQGPSGPGIFSNVKAKILNFYKTGNTKVKIGGTVLVVLLFLYLASTVVFAKATVIVHLSKATVSVNEQVQGDPAATTVDYENTTLPVRQITLDSTSSNSVDTTGNVKAGNKAQGLVNIYNKTEKEINLPAGTKIQNLSTSLNYQLTSAATVPPATISGGVVESLGIRKDVPIQAESFGENYNTSGTSNYKIDGYTTDQLSAKSFNDIAGGDTSEDRAVAQKDIDDLKTGLTEELKNKLQSEMQQLVSEDEILLDESIAYGTPEVSSDKKVDEKADSVNVTVKLSASAYVVSKTDLKTFVLDYVQNNSELDGDINTSDLADPEVRDVAVASGKVSFSIVSDGDVTGGVTSQEIAKNISGKSIGDANSYLDSLSGVESYDLSVSPFYVPSFLKKVPGQSKVDVRIRTAE